MAEKRMFTQKIVDSDAFLEMPLSAQALYFHLNMRADDDGFVNNPKRVTKLINASEDDLKILLIKRFIIGFASGVIVIKHWRMHNTLKSDRYHPTDYQEEFQQLGIKPNKAYTDDPSKLLPPEPPTAEPTWNQDGTNLEPENRRDKDLGEDIGLGLEESSKSGDSTAAETAAVLTFLLNDGSEYPITQAYIDQMREAFPAVDVYQEFREMKAWCINNPRKRKTRRGITSFVNNWLSREQDRGGSRGCQRPAQQQSSRTAMEDLQTLYKGFSAEDRQ